MVLKTKVIIGILIFVIVTGGVVAGINFFSRDTKKAHSPEVSAYVDDEIGPVYPLSGLRADDEDATKTRPLCIKMPNDAPARPQTGINSADVVYETMVEGGETRMNAIYQSNIPEEVGPVRSARLSDIWIVPQYNGMLFFSGANDQVRGEIASHDISDMRWSFAESIYFRSDNGRGDLHNLHIRLNEAYNAAKGRDYETSSDEPNTLHFVGVNYKDSADAGDDNDDSVDAGDADDNGDSGSDSDVESDGKLEFFNNETSKGSYVQVVISHISDIEFKWDSEKERYLKWMNGVEHKDAIDDEQINVVNVVVLWAEYIQQSKVDAAGSPTFDTNLGGTGKAAVFKNGERFDCEWKADENTPPRFYDSNGDEVLLNPGNTWIMVPPENVEITSE